MRRTIVEFIFSCLCAQMAVYAECCEPTAAAGGATAESEMNVVRRMVLPNGVPVVIRATKERIRMSDNGRGGGNGGIPNDDSLAEVAGRVPEPPATNNYGQAETNAAETNECASLNATSNVWGLSQREYRASVFSALSHARHVGAGGEVLCDWFTNMVLYACPEASFDVWMREKGFFVEVGMHLPEIANSTECWLTVADCYRTLKELRDSAACDISREQRRTFLTNENVAAYYSALADEKRRQVRYNAVKSVLPGISNAVLVSFPSTILPCLAEVTQWSLVSNITDRAELVDDERRLLEAYCGGAVLCLAHKSAHAESGGHTDAEVKEKFAFISRLAHGDENGSHIRRALHMAGDDTNRFARILREIAVENTNETRRALQNLGIYKTSQSLPFLYSYATNATYGADALKAALAIEGATSASIAAAQAYFSLTNEDVLVGRGGGYCMRGTRQVREAGWD